MYFDNKEADFFYKKVNIIKQFIKQEFFKYNIFKDLLFDINFETKTLLVKLTENIEIIEINNPNPNTDFEILKNTLYDFIEVWIPEFKKSEIIKNLINTIYKKQIEDKDFEIFFDYDFFEMNLQIHINKGNNKSNFLIGIDENFKIIQRKINKIVELIKDNEKNKECSICYNKKNRLVVCSRCLNHICADCYFDILKKNKGLYRCPFCCFSFGHLLNNDDLKNWINQQKFNILLNKSNCFIYNIFINETEEEEKEQELNKLKKKIINSIFDEEQYTDEDTTTDEEQYTDEPQFNLNASLDF